MIFTGLDNKQYKVNLRKYLKKRKRVSSGHLRARKLLQELFPMEQLLEEFKLPGLRTNCYIDFFIPALSIMVEVNGEQHYKFNAFHYKNKQEFYMAQARDRKKQEWCNLNNIQLVIWKDSDNDEQWRQQICE